MRRAISFARRNTLLVVATALLMVGAGCVGAVRETGDQLTKDSLKPITAPIEAYGQAVESVSNTKAKQEESLQQSGLLEK
jgi:hypothetical protein